MHYKAISTIHVKAMPGAAIFLGEALNLAVARMQAPDDEDPCFLSLHHNSDDEWVIHRHWSSTPHLSDETDSLHGKLMELLSSGRVRNMRFDIFASDQVSQETRVTKSLDG